MGTAPPPAHSDTPQRPRAPTITVDSSIDEDAFASPTPLPSHTLESCSLATLCQPAPRSNDLLQVPGPPSKTANIDAPFHPPHSPGREASTTTASVPSQASRTSSSVTAVGHESQDDISTAGICCERYSSTENDTFGLSPGVLADMVTSKNLAEFRALKGLQGLELGLRTDCRAGLSWEEISVQDGGHERMGSSSATSSFSGHKLNGHRSAVFGTNRLPERKTRNLLQLMWLAFNDKVLIILSVVALISLALGLYQSFGQPHAPGQPRVEWVDGVTIMTAVIIVVVAGALNDYQKEKQFARLNKKKDDRMIKAIRSGWSVEISVYDVLAGDVLHVEPGDLVPVDGVLISCHNVRCDESSVTGESDQIKKAGGYEVMKRMDTDQSLDGLDPFVISGSKILEGIGTFLVTGVGVHSTYGRLSMRLTERTEATPLQTKLNNVADKIAMAGLAVAVFLFLVLTIKFLTQLPGRHDSPFDRLQTFLRIFIVSITVVVIAVPEGLPLAVTLALAIAVTRMLNDNNLVRILSACETMGNATTVCCDKTGTLTMNKMTVTAGAVGVAHCFGDLKPGDNDKRVPGPKYIESRSTTSSEGSSSKASPAVEIVPIGTFTSSLSLEVRNILIKSIAVNSTAFEAEEDGRPAFIGSKTEAALLSFAKEQLGMSPLNEERANAEVVEVFPFDSSRKCMTSVTKLPNMTYRMYVKGAPELLLEKSNRILADPSLSAKEVALTKQNGDLMADIINNYTAQSLRALGLAYRDFLFWPPPAAEYPDDESKEVCFEDYFADLTFLGVLGIQDPLRPGVKEAVRLCQHAGVIVRMVTGDNVKTATAIAAECGILTDAGLVVEGPQFRKLSTTETDDIIPRLQVLARSSPEDKRILVKRLKELGETVAVTGDGTNDGPALRAADVGFSMGLSGTEITKEASSIVLMDDNFASIVKAIEWGRAVNDVIKKFLQFQLTVNITAVTLTFVSAITSDTEESILTPVQLLWVNLIMDTFAALALATDPPDPSVLDRAPTRKSAPLISLSGWKMIVGQSIYQLTITLSLNFAGNSILGYTTPEETESLETLVFNSFVWMQFFNLYNNRRLDNKLNVFENIHRNLYFIGVNLVIIIGQVLIIFFGGSALSAVRLTATQWAISLFLGVLSIPVGMTIRLIPDSAVQRMFPASIDNQLSPRIHARDDGFIWNEAIESVRSELVTFQQQRNSRYERLRQYLPDVGEVLAALQKKIPAWLAPAPPIEGETSPLLHPEFHPDGQEPRAVSAIAPAALLAGIVAGSVGGWSPVEAGGV